MSEIMINPAKTCAFTGHRIVSKDLNIDELKSKIESLIDIGYDTFLVGMAIGFDIIAFSVLEGIRKEKNIKIIACVPCINQSAKFTTAQKETYDKALLSADEIIYTGKYYTDKCMQKRNEFMVKNSSCLISYVRRSFGGSVNTVKYAIKKGVIVISL